MTQTSIFQVDVNGKLIIPQYATLVQLTPGVNGLVLPSTLPLNLNTILSVNPIYLNLNNRAALIIVCNIIVSRSRRSNIITMLNRLNSFLQYKFQREDLCLVVPYRLSCEL